MKLILLALAGAAAVCLVGCAGAVMVDVWWSDRVSAPDPELDEIVRGSAGACYDAEGNEAF